MKNNFLEDVWYQANKNRRTFASIMFVIFVCCFAFIVFMVKVVMKETINLEDPTTQKLVTVFLGMGVLMILSLLVVVIKSFTVAKNGSNLILPYEGQSKEELARIINEDIKEGKFLVNEHIYEFKEDEKKYGERVILTSSYLLLANVNGSGKVIWIPREKIYWLCAQPGIKGSSSYIVRLLVFTENEMFTVDGTDVDYVEELVQKLYEYIPNVFKNYEVFKLSYELQKCFEQNRPGFIAFYEEEKKRNG